MSVCVYPGRISSDTAIKRKVVSQVLANDKVGLIDLGVVRDGLATTKCCELSVKEFAQRTRGESPSWPSL